MGRNLSTLLLWGGLVLCGYAIWKLGGDSFAMIGMLKLSVAALLASLVLAVWVTSVAAWRNYLHSFTGAAPAWREASRQIGLLLIGKYIPGGIFGFVARLYDETHAQRGRLLAAGVVEQLVGMAMSILLGALLFATAWYRQPSWLLLLVLLPLLAVVGTQLFARTLRHSHRLHQRIPRLPSWSRPRLLLAALLSLLQHISWALAVGLLGMHLFGLDLLGAIGVAGAFGLAVGVGVLVVVSPGGIGVREGAMTALAGTWLGFESALLLAALLRVISVGLDLLAGIFVLVVGKRKPSGLGESHESSW